MSTTYGDLFAANMRAARARAGLSQPAVSRRMKRLGFGSWSAGKVSECERGVRVVPVADLLGLALALECTLVDLVAHAAPNDTITMPDPRFEVSGVMIRNSGYGWRDFSVTWDPGSEFPVISRPANPFSGRAEDKSDLIARMGPITA